MFIQGAEYFRGVSHINTNGYACFSLSMCVTLLTWKFECIGTFVSECVFLSFRMMKTVYLCVVCSFHLTILPPMERLLSPEVPAADKLFRHSEIFKFLLYSFYLFFVTSFFIGFIRYYFFLSWQFKTESHRLLFVFFLFIFPWLYRFSIFCYIFGCCFSLDMLTFSV